MSGRGERAWPPGLYAVRGVMSVCHVLVDETGVVLLDTGFLGHAGRIRRLLRKLGLGPQDVRAILLTHGHLDHAAYLAPLKAWTGAPIYAHPAEQAHLDGTYPYKDDAVLCGWLEAAGRVLLRYRTAKIDRPLADGDELPFWGGLRVVHLPGHTEGHCGFYSAKHDLLFSGDLFAHVLSRTILPPRYLNSQPERIRASLTKAQALRARWIVPNHYDIPDAALQRQRFERLCDRLLGKRAPVI